MNGTYHTTHVDPSVAQRIVANLDGARDAEVLDIKRVANALGVFMTVDGQQVSVGFDWLRRNPTVLKGMSDVATQLTHHIPNPTFPVIINDPRLLRRFPSDERAELIRTVLEIHGSSALLDNGAWIEAAAESRVKAEDRVVRIFDWLERGSEEAVRTFLGYDSGFELRTVPGASLPELVLTTKDSSVWRLMWTHKLLHEALMLCAQRLPKAFFALPAPGDQLSLRAKIYAQVTNRRGTAPLFNDPSADRIMEQAYERIQRQGQPATSGVLV